ncbi:signal peptidase I [Streptomyces sp. ACA25]|uniref:signal peptidase I n=1 Tax=Streptomyces sp. ACA25 TaxID=3022596 RepID=UPI00230792B1|nr:signal peptidase I [Streptomyces sp. ACA25]MDB1089647.1 signal peptidase I [Streptomyces sp. ACA25]
MTGTDTRSRERDRSTRPGKGWRQRSRSLRVWAALLALTVSSGLLISAFVMQPFLIPSGSMESTLHPGDRILVNKLAYRFGGDVRRGDVVVFDGRGTFTAAQPDGSPLREAGAAVGLADPGETDYVKRVIGVGGDRVTCCDGQGRLHVNGVPLDERYLFPGDAPSTVAFDIEVPAGRLWLMGDHRSDSADSRDHLGGPGGGTVAVDKVIGRAEWIGWPASRWGSVRAGHG